MADDATTTDVPTDEPKEEEQRVPLERFQKENQRAKEAVKAAADAQKRADELQAKLEERDHASLPELEQLRKAHEKAEKRAADAEARVEQVEQGRVKDQRKSLVRDKAEKLGFQNPSKAHLFVDLDSIEDGADAERALKAAVKDDKWLVKDEKPGQKLGQVIDNGREPNGDRKGQVDPLRAADEEFAQSAAEKLRQMVGGSWGPES